MGNAVIQRIALHPNAIERNVFRIAWQSRNPHVVQTSRRSRATAF